VEGGLAAFFFWHPTGDHALRSGSVMLAVRMSSVRRFLMRIVMWTLRFMLFFILFGFAVKNDQFVTLNFFFGQAWEMPLVFVILAAFAAGAILGVTATFASLLRKRREIGRLKRDLVKVEKSQASAASAATAGGVIKAG
jgi:lipopolysaccharide assembly protein A